MSGLSNYMDGLFAQLGKQYDLRSRAILRSPETAALLEEIGDHGGVGAIPSLLDYAFSADSQVVHQLCKAVAKILSRASGADLLRLDSAMRDRGTWGGSWWSMKPADLNFLNAFPEEEAAMLSVATMHPSGYIRETALHRLHNMPEPGAISYFLIRANDWVQEVRIAATKNFKDYLNPKYRMQLIAALPIVLSLRKRERGNHRPLVQSVLTFLRHADSHADLLRGFESRDRVVQRACLEVASGAVGLGLSRLIILAQESNDPIVRLKAAELCKRLDDTSLETVLPLLMRDAYMPVRRQALRSLISRFPARVDAALNDGLFDRSIAIRSMCRTHLRKRGPENFAEFYRSALAELSSHRLEIALLGLGETGNEKDANSVAAFLKSEAARVRAAAARSLGRLDGRGRIPDLMTALQDTSPRVSRMARFALEDLVGSIGHEELWQALRLARQPHGRRNIVVLMAGLLRVPRLLSLLRVACRDDPTLVSLAQNQIERWLRRSDGFIPDQGAKGQAMIGEIQALLRGRELKLPVSLVQALRFIFDRL